MFLWHELSHVRSNTMPKSPFTGLYTAQYKPTSVLPFTAHAFNSEKYAADAEPAQHGTPIDALGHFAYLEKPWDGRGTPPLDTARYYGGYTQQPVKPTPDSPLLKLGVEKAPPLVSSAVLLDAQAGVGQGRPLKYDAAQFLGRARIVAVGLDVPFIDPVAEGFLQGKAEPAAGTPACLPFAVHHHLLTQRGIHPLESVRAADRADSRDTLLATASSTAIVGAGWTAAAVTQRSGGCELSARPLRSGARANTVLRPSLVLSGRRRAARWWSPSRRRAAGAPPSGIRALE
jgi:hypothetical protein